LAIARRVSPTLVRGLFAAVAAAGSARTELATPEQKKSLHTRCLSSLRRRDSECPGDHRLPAAAESQSQQGLPGGLRAVGISFQTTPDSPHHQEFSNRSPMIYCG
jgi:hypothetical protein